jgi:secreted PhoX family phosphatase
MAKDFDLMEDSNRSGNPGLQQVSLPARRTVLTLGTGALAQWLFARSAMAGGASATAARLGFASVPTSNADRLSVPAGYTAEVIAPWGDPVGIAGAMPAWRPDASNSAADQALQLGMHHDGMAFFSLGGGHDGHSRGLLAINHEYTDPELLFPDGSANWSAEKVRKSQNAHGLAVVEVALKDGRWQLVRPSRYARRVTMDTPFAVGGPAAGHVLMRTAADPDGRRVRGTMNNCAAGPTPWGTYLSGEENWAGYFACGDTPTADQRRWGATRRGWARWEGHDERFDAQKHPNEFHRFGWVVELDPFDPSSTPVKRTALGRAAHEGATVGLTRDGRAVVYSGEDARFEYIYKFVSRDRMASGGAAANRALLDHGTLYVARFDADGSGQWLPLVQGRGPLTAVNGFADQGEVVIKARQASDLLGATRMDRPEWIAIDPLGGEVYCTLTNNTARGSAGAPAPDAANPRADNTMGHIVRWKEDGDLDAERFRWNHLLLAGDPAAQRPEARGNIRGDFFACPDGITFSPNGLLWIQTDVSARAIGRGEHSRVGNNQMLACDVRTGEVRRFLVGPAGCEITGACFTPDGRTLFVNIQHPGEPASDRTDPARPGRWSTWPSTEPGARPRSATVAVRRSDGGEIGS